MRLGEDGVTLEVNGTCEAEMVGVQNYSTSQKKLNRSNGTCKLVTR